MQANNNVTKHVTHRNIFGTVLCGPVFSPPCASHWPFSGFVVPPCAVVKLRVCVSTVNRWTSLHQLKRQHGRRLHGGYGDNRPHSQKLVGATPLFSPQRRRHLTALHSHLTGFMGKGREREERRKKKGREGNNVNRTSRNYTIAPYY